MIEVETKLAVARKADFTRLLEALPEPVRDRLQLNLYLDTRDGKIAGMRASLRLRISCDRAWITMKRRIASERDEVFVAKEEEEETPRQVAVDWLEGRGRLAPPEGKGFGSIMDLFDGDRLCVTTWSRTRRRAYDMGGGVVIEADETDFPDGYRDYEIEIEDVDPDVAGAVTTDLAARAGITLRPQTATKHARALSHQGTKTPVAP